MKGLIHYLIKRNYSYDSFIELSFEFFYRKFDLASHHELKAHEFNDYVKLFDNYQNIVYFNVSYCLQLKWMTISKFLLSLKSVTYLHMLGIELKTKDLIYILKEFKLTEISFTFSLSCIEDEKLITKPFQSSALSVIMDSQVSVENLFCLLEKFISLKKLKLINTHDRYGHFYPETRISLPVLEEFIMFGRSFDLSLNEPLLPFLYSLKYFLVSISANVFKCIEESENEESNNILNRLKLLFDLHKLTFLALNFNDIERREGLRIEEINLNKFLNRLNNKHLKTLSLHSHKKSFKLIKISELSNHLEFLNLTSLKIENIHIHQTSSFCDSLSNLKSIKFYLVKLCYVNILQYQLRP